MNCGSNMERHMETRRKLIWCPPITRPPMRGKNLNVQDIITFWKVKDQAAPVSTKYLTAKRDSYPGPVEPVETEENSLTSLHPGLETEIRRGTSRTERNRTKLWPQNCTSYLVYTHRKSQENRTITMDPSKLFS